MAMTLYNAERQGGFSQDARALLRLISANASTAVRLFLSRIERERSEKLSTIGKMLSGVMHDMRTPLSFHRLELQALAGNPEVPKMARDKMREAIDALVAKSSDAAVFLR